MTHHEFLQALENCTLPESQSAMLLSSELLSPTLLSRS